MSEKWIERFAEAGEIGIRSINYDLGYPKIEETKIFLHHDDVPKLMVKMLDLSKFRQILSSRFPYLFVDEYQDTDKDFADAIKTHFIETESGPNNWPVSDQNRYDRGSDRPCGGKEAGGPALFLSREPVGNHSHRRRKVLSFADRQTQAKNNELRIVSNEAGDKGDQGEDPDCDVHRFLRPYSVGKVSGQELGERVAEKEYRSQPTDLNNR